ncbi:MAG: hypothetical protein MZU95_14110 [Desulfomicrobium escambiense]|nr:hypothetical protein [Desulfomicrobium escambiense]
MAPGNLQPRGHLSRMQCSIPTCSGIEQYYADNGYMQAKVGRPKIDIREDDGIYITIPVSEGPLFTMGTIDVAGDLILPREDLLDAIELESGETMSKSRIQQAIERIRDIYMDMGYAYVQIKPESTEEEETKVGLTFRITQGKPVTIDSIQIRGNTKTRDKVIRRELEIEEEGPSRRQPSRTARTTSAGSVTSAQQT